MDYSNIENKKLSKEHSDGGAPRAYWKILTVFGISIAILAIVISTVSLTLVLVKLQQQTPQDQSDSLQETRRQLEPLRTTKETEQLVAEVVHTKHFNGHRNARSINCLDYSEEQMNKTPTAHITAKDRYQEITFKENKIQIISDKWLCSSKYNKAHVAGGMVFIDGFLKVPSDGIYFIYSQVSSKVENISTANNKIVEIGHNTMICECEDAEELDGSCACFTEETPSKKFSSTHNKLYMRAGSEGFGNIAGSSFHGGLFHLTANSYISIIPLVTKLDNPETKVIADFGNSFFGAFLVSQ